MIQAKLGCRKSFATAPHWLRLAINGMFKEETPDVPGGRLRVKICGITNQADVEAAIDAGADAVGLNCYVGSKRHLDVFAAADWLAALPAHLSRVAVVVNLTLAEASAIAALPYIDALQLHGQETPEFCRALAATGVRLAKALPATDAVALAGAVSFRLRTIVLDSSSAGAFGGTGTTFPWKIATDFAANHPELRVILAGGLNARNVANAVRAVRPFGVDVTSGIELAPGRKDHAQMRAFITAARAA